MRKEILFLLAVVLFVAGCKKDRSCEGCDDDPPIGSNKPPVAHAGADQKIALPSDSALLDGSGSSDPDGTISSYKWTKLSGPPVAVIANTESVKTIAKALVMGVYSFELTVQDNSGAFAKDTVQVTVEHQPTGNQPPVARAGADQSFPLPINAVTLDGSSSTDPDNNIASYQWIKVSGPTTFAFSTAAAARTLVSDLAEGTYEFELTVTDAQGLSSKDTVQVRVEAAAVIIPCDNSNRPLVNARLIPIGTLSEPRNAIATAAAGDNIVFAGGFNHQSAAGVSSRVDIYNTRTNTWSTAELSEARGGAAGVAAGNKIFIAGGDKSDVWFLSSRTVDIYDVATNTWSATALRVDGIGVSAAAVGDKVLFAGYIGGGALNSRVVDIYDLRNSSWSAASLSEGREYISAVTVGNKVYFAGGQAPTTHPTTGGSSWKASNVIDIYDYATNSWSKATLKEGRVGPGGIAVGDKIYWAGGLAGNGLSPTSSYIPCSVEIRDVATGNTSMATLHKPTRWLTAVAKDNKIIFLRVENGVADKFDIYDRNTNTWSIGVLPVSIEGPSIIAADNVIYLTEGTVNGVTPNQVWKLEF
jgi:hypothetical protein